MSKKKAATKKRKEKNDGGQAFPALFNEFGECVKPGMSLRDYIAAEAIHGMVEKPDLDWEWRDIAETAYDLADAMIAARKK